MKILVTGAFGFLGQHVMSELWHRGYGASPIPVGNKHDVSKPVFGSNEGGWFCDLRNLTETSQLIEQTKPDIILHLAAKCGGIGANQSSPAEFFEDNMHMGMNLINASHSYEVNKFVLVGTVCSYPKFCPVPFKEEDLWNGYPEETNAPYGIAKKALTVMLNAYREQYGLNGITVIPVNMYGPGDNFDLETSHVVPGIIRRMIEAEGGPVTLWGTGQASREFLYVKDAARGIVDAMEKYDDPMPINLGTGEDIKIMELAELIADIMKYKGTIFFDSNKPDGQPRRQLNISNARRWLGFESQVTLAEGLEETIKWYQRRVRYHSFLEKEEHKANVF